MATQPTLCPGCADGTPPTRRAFCPDTCSECGRPVHPAEHEAATRIDEAADAASKGCVATYAVRWGDAVGTIYSLPHADAEPLAVALAYPAPGEVWLAEPQCTALRDHLGRRGLAVRVPGREGVRR